MNWSRLAVLVLVGTLVCSCGGGDAPSLTSAPDPHVVGDCGSNTWEFTPFREVVTTSEVDTLVSTTLVAFHNEVGSDSYLEVVLRDTEDAEFPEGEAIDLSEQMTGFSDFESCDACVIFRHQCRADANGNLQCHKIFVAREGSLTISERGVAVGETLRGMIYDLVLVEDVTESVDPSAAPARLCMLEYDFNTKVTEVAE